MSIEDLIQYERGVVGLEVGPTNWREVRQEDITAFGTCTYDPDPMHIDVAWAQAHSPFGRTIAFGFWTLSMLTCLMKELAELNPAADRPSVEGLIGINYGCDRLRFIEPVEVGSRIRARSTLVSVERIAPDRLRRVTDVTVDVEHKEKPALLARWLSMSILPDPATRLTGFRRV